jgi:hypothetical protein
MLYAKWMPALHFRAKEQRNNLSRQLRSILLKPDRKTAMGQEDTILCISTSESTLPKKLQKNVSCICKIINNLISYWF